MAKPKYSTALYEVIRKGDAGVKCEGTRVSEPSASPARPDPPPAAGETPQPHEGVNPWVAASDDEAPAPRAFEVADGRVRVSLTTTGVAAVIVGAAMLLGVAYWAGARVGERQGREAGYAAGRESVESESWDAIRAARAQLPADGLFEGVGVAPVRRSGTDAEAASQLAAPVTGGVRAGWVQGYTYVVVQDFRADALADVERARQYLADNGLETAVIELSGDWRYRLITTQGFNRDDPVQRKLADDYLARLRQLGQTYFEGGGRYRLEGYFKKLTTETW